MRWRSVVTELKLENVIIIIREFAKFLFFFYFITIEV